MNTCEIIQPSALLTRYIKEYWFVTIDNIACCPQRLVPFNGTILIFHIHNKSCGNTLFQSVLHGVTTGYTDLISVGKVSFISIVFQPGGSYPFFSMPPGELNNTYIPLDNLNDKALTELEQQLTESPGISACVALIEQFLFRRVSRNNMESDKRIDTVLASIHNGETNLTKLAETACLSYKQFKRVFTATTGSNPKEYLKIERFQRLHSILQQHSKMSVSQLAETCGYYDKSHLMKELKEFTGFTPAQLRTTCDQVYSCKYAWFRSVFVDLPGLNNI